MEMEIEESACHPAQQTQHALLLQDILEVLFKKLPLKELKECRQVCTVWEKASKEIVKKKSELRLTGDIQRNYELGEFLRQDFHNFIPSKLKIQIRWDASVKEEIYSGSNNPGGDGQTEARNRVDYIERLHKGLEDIYGILGKQSFEELQIYGDFSQYTAGRLSSILGFLSPSLISLQICFTPENAIKNEQETLAVCPLLTKLSIGSAPEWFHSRVFSACPNLTEINGTYPCKLEVLEKTSGGLTKISGFSCCTQKDLELLGRKTGNLAELSLKVKVTGKIEESILEFVQSKNESLKFLELEFQTLPYTVRLGQGQGFSQLNKLHLEAAFDQEKHSVLEICFSGDTPQLKYFKLRALSHSNKQNWGDLLAYRSNITRDGRVIPLLTLTHLDLAVEGKIDRDCANYLRQLFPTLTSFKIKRPTEDFLRGIWQMENLVEIQMERMEDNNQGIEDLGVALFGTLQEDQEVEESIINLKKLRCLSINKRRWNGGGNKIPEGTVRNGFGKMESLTVLELPRFYMTPEGSEYLWSNLPYLKKLKIEAVRLY